MNQSTGSLPRAHQTMVLAHRAMLRDLDRIAAAASGLGTEAGEARTAALRDYTLRLAALIEHHHEGEDEILWPALRSQGAPQEALDALMSEHAEVTRLLDGVKDHAGTLTPGEPAQAFSAAVKQLRDALAEHTADEERELTSRLAPTLDERIWKRFERQMLRTAPRWTLTFMPPWLASVAEPGESGGVPAPPVARLFRGRLRRTQRQALGDVD